jgi:DNA invertase Pin-like site-specific DNA recombinase
MRLSGEQLSVDGYVRVSKVGRRKGERFISPAVQREVIETWASARGARILEVFEELDRPGGRGDRPLYEKALRRVESGASQGIVVSNVDRFGRSLISGVAAIEKITAAGGTVFAIENGLDTSTDTGQLVMHILLSMAQWQSARTRASWEQARARAITRGVYAAPGAPVGYRRTRSSRLRPDPQTADVIADVFRRRASGETAASLGRWLEAQGIRTSSGNPGWTSTSTFCLLRSRVYLGQVRWGPYVNERAHPAIVDQATWQAAQHPRRVLELHEREPPLLKRLVRCAGCSMVMSAAWRRNHGQFYVHYSCSGRSAAGRCPAPASIAAESLEPYIEECAFDLLRRRRRAPAVELATAEDALTMASGALARYRDSDRILSTLGQEAFAEGLAARSERVRRARLHVAELRDARQLHTLPAVTELEDRWIGLDDRARRVLIAQVIDCAFVTAAHLPVEDRVTVCPTGTAPRLPRAGGKPGGEARPFTPRARHRSLAPRPWTTARIERELSDFLHGRRTWPTAAAFAAAGRRRLYDQVARHAGIECWAHHFGLPTIFSPRSYQPWTESRVRAGLRLYLRRKRRWPTQAQFEADGLKSLHRALRRTGGTHRWSTELGLPLAPNQRHGLRS